VTSKHAIQRQASLEAKKQGGPGYPRMYGPIFKTPGLTVPHHVAYIFSVSALFGVSGPSAVLGRVGTVVVEAINRMSHGRSSSHIRKELLKRVYPLIAHADTTSTVVFPAWLERIRASGFNGRPNRVLVGAGPSMGQESSSRGFVAVAAARFLEVGRQLLLNDGQFASTVAPAPPAGMSPTGMTAQDGQSVVSFAGQIRWLWSSHGAIISHHSINWWQISR
jgi:hypothetical protein